MGILYCKKWPNPLPSSLLMPFYGANGHMTWGSQAYVQSNWPNNAAALRDLGLMTYRNGYGANYNSSNGAITSSDGATFNSFMTAYPDITVVPVLLPRWSVAYDNTSAGTETTAYTMGYNLGVDAATKLGNKVPYYEVGNEYENGKVSGAGASKTDFDNTMFLQARGSVRGMIAGIHSVLPNAKIALAPGSWLHFGLWDMFADGTTPAAPNTVDSSKIISWDLSPWHIYTQNSTGADDFENLSGQPITNGMAKLASYGKPMIISEFGVNTYSGSTALYADDAAIIAAMTTKNYLFDKWYSIRNKYAVPLIGVQLYQLADAAADGSQNEMGFGITGSDGITKKGWYSAVKSFVATHPVS